MKMIRWLFFCAGLLLALQSFAADNPVFRLSISNDPTNISPLGAKVPGGSYLLQQLHSPLLHYNNGSLRDQLGHCKIDNSTKITCTIFSSAKFSNGAAITAKHFQDTILAFLNPNDPGMRADLFYPIKNAELINQGKQKPDALGFKINNDKSFSVTLDPQKMQAEEFIYTFANPLAAPLYSTDKAKLKVGMSPDSFVGSGAFKIKSWQQSKPILLTPNPFFPDSKINFDVQFTTVSEDAVALSLFEKQDLDFIRHLPTLLITQYQNSPLLKTFMQFRFDAFVFGPALSKAPELRHAMTSALNYDELQELFHARPRPGCVGIPNFLFVHNTCNIFDPHVKKWDKETPAMSLLYSKLGGEDHERAAQWMQSEWKKRLNINVQLRQLENKIFLQEITNDPPAIYRKGLTPDRPTCLAALEPIIQEIQKSLTADQLNQVQSTLQKMCKEKSADRKKEYCSNIIDLMVKNDYLIPTGPLYFSTLLNTHWQGLELNDLNELSLQQLRYLP